MQPDKRRKKNYGGCRKIIVHWQRVRGYHQFVIASVPDYRYIFLLLLQFEICIFAASFSVIQIKN